MENQTTSELKQCKTRSGKWMCGIWKPRIEFNSTGNQCKQCKSEYDKWYREKNKKHLTEISKKYREENKDKINVREKERRKINKDKKRIRDKQYYEKNKDKLRLKSNNYYHKNKEIISIQLKTYRQNNKEKLNLLNKKYREENKEKVKAGKKRYYEKNKQKVNRSNNERKKKRRKRDLVFRVGEIVSTLVRQAIITTMSKDNNKSNIKSVTSTQEILGDVIPLIPSYLESLFDHPDNLDKNGKPWMTWDNYGIHNSKTHDTNPTWQIDHIIPRSKLPFDRKDHPNVKLCWSLDNLRPLDARKNNQDSHYRTSEDIETIKKSISDFLANKNKGNK